jgi:hypothetical protein
MRRVLDLVLSASMECGSTVPRPAADCDWCNCRRAAASTLCVILRCVRQCLAETSYGHRRRAMRYLLPAHASEAASRVDALLHVALLRVMSVPWLGLAVSERPCTSSAQCPVTRRFTTPTIFVRRNNLGGIVQCSIWAYISAVPVPRRTPRWKGNHEDVGRSKVW